MYYDDRIILGNPSLWGRLLREGGVCLSVTLSPSYSTLAKYERKPATCVDMLLESHMLLQARALQRV